MEGSNRIPIDPGFAQHLDTNCFNCLHRYTDNKPQLRTIKNRRPETTGEQKALKGIEQKCKGCFKGGRNEIDSITATRSCDWRAGIK